MIYQALSILKPAVDLILDGKKGQEIRSWLPPTKPMRNVLLVQNYNYLTFEDDEDDGVALAFVDFTEFSSWAEEDYQNQSAKITLGRTWKPGYYTWKIENIRKLVTPTPCKAKKGIYQIELEDILIIRD
ncbi:TPA: hypothetical protein ACHJX8_001636 [Yersinia enterocolitica]